MSRLILLLAIATVGYLLYLRFKNTNVELDRAQLWRYGAIAVGVLLALMVVTGRAHGLFAFIAAALAGGARLVPLALRHFPLLRQLIGTAYAGVGPAKMNSEWLRLEIDVTTGRLDGVVLQGEYLDKRLSSMSENDLAAFKLACQDDAKSTRLLTAYLLRTTSGAQQQSNTHISAGEGAISSRSEALSILGLDENASPEDIVDAHRRLMRLIHPDKGGNDYLASRVNQAKDYLDK